MAEHSTEDNVRKSILHHVHKKFKEDQDFSQRFYIFFIVPLELYRVIVSSLLILFVPQDCGDGQLCSLTENIETTSFNYKAGLVCNFFTLFVFLLMYYYELRREHLLIKYLEVNPESKDRNSVVGRNLVYLAEEKKVKIYHIIMRYKYVGGFAIIMYVANAVISGVIISRYILGNQTYISFATNVLFMIQKFVDVYWTISVEPNVFLSAYIRTKIQYNDVDPKYKLTAEMIEAKDSRK